MPRSIPKKSNFPSSIAPTAPAAQSREERNKQTALYHAQLIQHRKDTETLILASTEALLELPSSPSADPARPSPSDVILVRSSLKPFQPSDYDALIEERNISEQCGYVLCPRKNRKQDTKARYRILHSKSKDSDGLKFVPRQDLEKWCSDDCGKRALYIKVQLNEEPSWTRADSLNAEITLLEDNQDRSSNATDSVRDVLGFDIKGEHQIVEKMKALAIERGDSGLDNRLRGLNGFDIRENSIADGKVVSPDSMITDRNTVAQHSSVEGYTPKLSIRTATGGRAGDDEDDLIRTI